MHDTATSITEADIAPAESIIPPVAEKPRRRTIEPTVGRVLHFWPAQEDLEEHGLVMLDEAQPMRASISFVRNINTINCTVEDHAGKQVFVRGLRLRQPDQPRPGFGHCAWTEQQVRYAFTTFTREPDA